MVAKGGGAGAQQLFARAIVGRHRS
jgi:hypothetical protein